MIGECRILSRKRDHAPFTENNQYKIQTEVVEFFFGELTGSSIGHIQTRKKTMHKDFYTMNVVSKLN